MPPRVRRRPDDIIAAIDIGTNAVRLEIARVLPDGTLEQLHQARDPIRPGEGLFETGLLKRNVADRLVATLRRYAALCRRYRARIRAVGTSALREARNRDDVVRRIRRESGLQVEVISGREEARLICLSVLHGTPPLKRSLCIDIGGGSTEVAFAIGEVPKQLWSVNLGAVRLTELFRTSGKVPKKQLKLMRAFASEVIETALPARIAHSPATALGSSGTIGAVVDFARKQGMGHATTKEVEKAVDALAEMDADKRRKRFDARRADIIVAGAVILEAFMQRLHLGAVTAVDQGLREGLLLDLVRRRRVDPSDDSLTKSALDVGRRLGFSEEHAVQVARVSLRLFDDLAQVHQLPAAVRPYLEAAALLHDVGRAVSHHRHHKHSHYLILNSDIPGLSEKERSVVACIARFHRRSPPEANHELLAPLPANDVRTIRKCATLLRIADSLDCSHRQSVKQVSADVEGRSVVVRLECRAPIDLELWDAEHEAPLFKEVFSRPLQFSVRAPKVRPRAVP